MKTLFCAAMGYLGLHSHLSRSCYTVREMDRVKDTSGSVTTPRATTVSYSDPWRPQVHFTPPENWMNDPNGLFRDEDGLWHLYYQYAPTITPGYLKDWGHATSQDLYTWTNQPIAIPGTADPLYAIFSGSIVVDVNNTSGFFPNQSNGVVAIFTAYTDAEEAQAIAYSTDGGYTFTFYAQNPVISLNQHGFRDPKVTWHAESGKWLMVVSHADEGFLAFYTSSNLIAWTQVSTYTPPVTGVLECPQFLGIPFHTGSTASEAASGATQPGHYILSVSIQSGGLNGGGIVRYFPGTFDGTTFTPYDDASTRVMDFGPDSYATAFFYDMKAGPKPISMSWAVNLQYATTVPTGTAEGWLSAQSVARTHYLANISPTGYDLISEPYDLTPIIASTLSSESNLGNGGTVVDYSNVASGALEFFINVTSPSYTTTSGNLNVGLDFTSSSTGEAVSLAFNLVTGTSSTSVSTASFSMSRANTTGWTAAPLSTTQDNVLPYSSTSSSTGPSSENYQIRGIIDRTILEVFLNGGVDAGTMIFFPTGELNTASLNIAGLIDGAYVDLEILALKSGWGTQNSKRRLVDGEDGTLRVDL